MCSCTPLVKCKYHWLDDGMKAAPELTRRALDWNEDSGVAWALAELMRNYDSDRVAKMRIMHILGER